jgi:hypothetical protein
MHSDPSWDIMPVVNPALRERKRRRLIRSTCAYDPVGWQSRGTSSVTATRS